MAVFAQFAFDKPHFSCHIIFAKPETPADEGWR